MKFPLAQRQMGISLARRTESVKIEKAERPPFHIDAEKSQLKKKRSCS